MPPPVHLYEGLVPFPSGSLPLTQLGKKRRVQRGEEGRGERGTVRTLPSLPHATWIQVYDSYKHVPGKLWTCICKLLGTGNYHLVIS